MGESFLCESISLPPVPHQEVRLPLREQGPAEGGVRGFKTRDSLPRAAEHEHVRGGSNGSGQGRS